ncbi:AAA family ATPase [Gordonibacter sp. 28C]|uniref:RNA-binding domain-containing protein n=1 Tax=Gordonibacter sp. 28C TaxID=2078569 RepID=UPI000DF7429D|nr:RNA-binding domain-containing protein [Gordonibacter sp. 28C]RDB59708.1 AAA family ATPase [Gordonibacter sp. 28C]
MFVESDHIEFKREYSKTVLKTVVAFANTDGGVIYLGIDDSGTICGLSDPDAVLLSATNAIRSSIKPDAAMVVQCKRQKMHGKQVVRIRVERGAKRPYYLSNKGMRPEGVYVRQGSASFMATEAEIASLLKETQKDSYEDRRCLVQKLTFDEMRAVFRREGVPYSRATLSVLGAVDEDGQFTNLGWLLSDQCASSIKLASFFGSKRTTFKHRLETGGSLLTQFDQALGFLAEHTHYKTAFVNMKRVDYDDYPPDAVREALINAIIHQDYGLALSTQVSVFEDRIEIVSHGDSPASYSLDEFQMDVSVPRNPKLAAAFYRIGLIEAYGTGIARMFEAYEGSGTAPRFDITDHLFGVVLPNRNGSDFELRTEPGAPRMTAPARAAEAGELRRQERAVLSVVEEAGPLRRSEIQERFDFSQATLLRILKRLEEQGAVQAEGNTRRRVYRALTIR